MPVLVTYWTGTQEKYNNTSVESAFNRIYNEPDHGGAWLSVDDDGIGHVYNEWHDECATIALV